MHGKIQEADIEECKAASSKSMNANNIRVLKFLAAKLPSENKFLDNNIQQANSSRNLQVQVLKQENQMNNALRRKKPLLQILVMDVWSNKSRDNACS